MAILQKRDFEQSLKRTEEPIGALDSIADEDSRSKALEAVRALLELHGDALARTLELLEGSGPAGAEMIEAVASDQVVGGLLILHGLHPRSLDERVGRALEKVRPYLGSHGGNVELLGTDGGVVSLRLEGSCHGCPSSTMTLKYAIEREILDAAPDVVAIEVEGVSAPPPVPPGFVPLSQVRSMGTGGGGEAWRELENLPELGSGEVHLAGSGGDRVLLLRLAGTLYAYRPRCAACGGDGFALAEEVLACSGCGHRYDARHAGRSLDADGVHLDPVPLMAEGAAVRVAAGAL